MGCSSGCGYTLTSLGRAQVGTFEGSSWCKAQKAELVLGTLWYCAEEKVKTVNNPPSANHWRLVGGTGLV